jgi:hypothetical protein
MALITMHPQDSSEDRFYRCGLTQLHRIPAGTLARSVGGEVAPLWFGADFCTGAIVHTAILAENDVLAVRTASAERICFPIRLSIRACDLVHKAKSLRFGTFASIRVLSLFLR